MPAEMSLDRIMGFLKSDEPKSSIKSNFSGLKPELQSLAQKLIEQAKMQGINLIVTDTLRTKKQQEALYNQGRTTEGPIVTNAKPGTSLHEKGLAFDVAVLDKNGKPSWPNDTNLWNLIGKIGLSLGLEWGGNFKSPDYPHFQIKNNITKNDFIRMKDVPDKNLHILAKIFLEKLKGKGYGSYQLFKFNGQIYKAVLEEHSDNKRGPHKGISLFKKANEESINLDSSLNSLFIIFEKLTS
jgi:peptidoglycan L-alanyl-D-glutamate endopeptidase CwlK